MIIFPYIESKDGIGISCQHLGTVMSIIHEVAENTGPSCSCLDKKNPSVISQRFCRAKPAFSAQRAFVKEVTTCSSELITDRLPHGIQNNVYALLC